CGRHLIIVRLPSPQLGHQAAQCRLGSGVLRLLLILSCSSLQRFLHPLYFCVINAVGDFGAVRDNELAGFAIGERTKRDFVTFYLAEELVVSFGKYLEIRFSSELCEKMITVPSELNDDCWR